MDPSTSAVDHVAIVSRSPGQQLLDDPRMMCFVAEICVSGSPAEWLLLWPQRPLNSQVLAVPTERRHPDSPIKKCTMDTAEFIFDISHIIESDSE